MKPVYGVANSNVSDLFSTIRRLKPKTQIVVPGFNEDSDLKDAKIVIASSVASLKRVRDLINDTCSLFVTDTVMNLKKIKEIILLDADINKDFSTNFYSITDTAIEDCLDTDEEYPYSRLRFKIIDVSDLLLKKTPTSVLSKIFTFLYSIPNKEKREKYRQAILYWLITPQLTEKYLVDKLKLRGKGKKILEYLTSEEVNNLRKLFNNSVNYKAAIKKYNIAEFDYNYLSKFKLTLKGKKQKTKSRKKKG